MASPEFPLPPDLTRVIGIHQSDVVIQSALEWGLADLRANPWLIDYAFASLPQDAVTARQYGAKTVAAAKAWFLKTNVSVQMGPIQNELEVPRVSIQLVASGEAENEATTADTHYEPFEENDRSWPVLAKLTVASWDPDSGEIVVSDNLPDDVYLAAGMSLVDNRGQAFQILDTDGHTNVTITANVTPDFRQCLLKPSRPAWVTQIESSSFRETYRVGVHVSGEPAHLVWLHSLVVFVLLRYKELLLEARGFERSTFSSTDLAAEPIGDSQPIFARFITINGFIRHYWPKAVTGRIDAVRMDPIRVSGQGGEHVKILDAGVDPDTQLWVGDLDSISTVKRK